MNSRTLLLAASVLLALVQPTFAQADPHHPSGSPDATSSEQPAPTPVPTPAAPPAASEDPAPGCPTGMSMADMMKMMQGMGNAPEAEMLKMMEMMATMQSMQMTMMQQMQQLQSDIMKSMPAPAQEQPK